MLIDYDGGPFNGWQRQAGGQLTVQGAIETALARLEPGPHTIAAAGRTDSGVHATGQVAHCDLSKDWDPFRLASALNAHLRPHPVAVLGVVWWRRISTRGSRRVSGAICSGWWRGARLRPMTGAGYGGCIHHWIWKRCRRGRRI